MPDWAGLPVVVAGAGVSGLAAVRALVGLGAEVTVVDDRVTELEGVVVRRDLPARVGLVVTSPGFRPTTPVLREAAARGIEVIGEVELAWRLRAPGAAPWLALTGTNGKTTTVTMLEAILQAAGHRAVAAGNVGLPLLDAVLAPDPYDVLAVELSSFQLHWSSSLRPRAGAVLNLADDHVDWHGSFEAYSAAKARVLDAELAVGNADDPRVAALLERAPAPQVSFTLGSPRAGQVGVVEDLLVDRAFPDVAGEATELATLGDLALPGDHNVANALAAATLARAHGVPAQAVRDGLRGYLPQAHRNALVAEVAGVRWVDDSKATNPHAAAASLASYAPVVWVAGGLLKGADVEDLVRQAAPRLRAAVLLGTDRAVLAEALARHAPDVPVVQVSRLDTGAMEEVVEAARSLARPGDTVLLAPAAASMDCFRDYAERGDLFAAAARGSA